MKSGLLLLSILIISGCSLRYNSSFQDEANVPEFIFTDATFTKYEDSTKKLSLSAETLEQYSEGNSMYAKGVSFKLLNKEGEIETQQGRRFFVSLYLFLRISHLIGVNILRSQDYE